LCAATSAPPGNRARRIVGRGAELGGVYGRENNGWYADDEDDGFEEDWWSGVGAVDHFSPLVGEVWGG